MNLDRHITVAFTGHRTYCSEAASSLKTVLDELYGRGFRMFLSGMAVGFDLAAAEAVLRLRGQHADVRLVAVIPFAGQSDRFPADDKLRFERVCREADEVMTLAPHFDPYCYMRRNDFLVDHALVLVAWYDGTTGGTRYTVERALRQGLEVRQLYPHAISQPTLF